MSAVGADGAHVHSATELFFTTADVIETLYLYIDYDEAAAAASQDFINSLEIVLDLDWQKLQLWIIFLVPVNPWILILS